MEGGISLKVSSGRFTLTCVTTGGPATSVVWIRGSALVHGTRTTMLDDPATARYTHTLTVSGRLRSDFRCIVTNEISRAEASFIPGITLYCCLCSLKPNLSKCIAIEIKSGVGQ